MSKSTRLRIPVLAVVWAIGLGIAAPSHAMERMPKIGNLSTTAQAAEPGAKGKSENDGIKGKSDPSMPQSTPAPKPSSSTMQNAPQAGVPARCASIADPGERQKCMNTPKGQ